MFGSITEDQKAYSIIPFLSWTLDDQATIITISVGYKCI